MLNLTILTCVFMTKQIAVSFILLAWFVQSVPSFSQGRLVGRVTDENANPVPAATVYLISTNFTQATITNASGYFTLLDIPLSTYEIKAYKRGYPIWQKNFSIASSSTFRIDIKLVESSLANIETRATKDVQSEAKKIKRPSPKTVDKVKEVPLETATVPASTSSQNESGVNPQTVSETDIEQEEGLRQSVQTAKDVVVSDAVKPDTKPEIIGGIEALNRKIIYPTIAREQGLQGGVIAKVNVDKFGDVTKVTILRSTNPSFSEEVFRVLSDDIRFKPATLNNQPVAASAVIYVEFKLN